MRYEKAQQRLPAMLWALLQPPVALLALGVRTEEQANLTIYSLRPIFNMQLRPYMAIFSRHILGVTSKKNFSLRKMCPEIQEQYFLLMSLITFFAFALSMVLN